jgi:hypothetical protein
MLKFSKIFSEDKAQANDVFRLMIDAILGLAILAIVMSTITAFGQLRQEISVAEMRGLVEGAVQTPTGKIVESDTLAFSEGEGYTGAILEEWTGVPANCFLFQSNLSVIKIVEGPGGGAIFESNVDTKAFARCVVTGQTCEYGEGDCGVCELECTISFGKKLTNP